jgi:hypothetical protein
MKTTTIFGTPGALWRVDEAAVEGGGEGGELVGDGLLLPPLPPPQADAPPASTSPTRMATMHRIPEASPLTIGEDLPNG